MLPRVRREHRGRRVRANCARALRQKICCTRGWGRSCKNVTIFRNYRSSADTQSGAGSSPAHAATMAGQHALSNLECAACAKSAMTSAGCLARRRRYTARFRVKLRRLGACAHGHGCCRARAVAPSHQISTTGSREHCGLVWLAPDRLVLLAIRLPGHGADVLSSQHDRSGKVLSTVQIAGAERIACTEALAQPSACSDGRAEPSASRACKASNHH